MEVILLEPIHKLGSFGETVKVANGYARNYLIPQKKAMRVTAEAITQVEKSRQQLAQEESKRLEVAQAKADLTVREVTIARLAGEGGKLYGSVSSVDIVQALQDAGGNIEKSEVFQPDGPIKQLGEFTAKIILHAEVQFPLKINVIEGVNAPSSPEDAPLPDAVDS